MNLLSNQFQRRALIRYVLVFVLGALMVLGAQMLWTRFQSCNQHYDLLNSAFRCDTLIQQGEWDYEPLRDELSAKKSEYKASGKLSHVSIYFRDLTHGPRFGIGEYDKFQPASLLKLPVLIAFLHAADLDPNMLNKTLSFSGALNVNENVEESYETIKPNTPYTIQELLTKMIVYSDNFSYKLLTQELNEEGKRLAYFTFRDLDVLQMMLTPKADFISIQSYGTLFAILYNTGYLSREMSQFALEILSQTTFKDGLVAGVPENIRVAHKFGRRVLQTEDDQLHDCGIVYHPKMAYILCVMTSGAEYSNQKSAIAEVSHIVYEAVSSQHTENP